MATPLAAMSFEGSKRLNNLDIGPSIPDIKALALIISDKMIFKVVL